MGRCNNQPIVGFCGGVGIREEMRTGGACGGGCLLIVLGSYIEQGTKLKLREQAWMASSGLGNATTNQKLATMIGYDS